MSMPCFLMFFAFVCVVLAFCVIYFHHPTGFKDISCTLFVHIAYGSLVKLPLM